MFAIFISAGPVRIQPFPMTFGANLMTKFLFSYRISFHSNLSEMVVGGGMCVLGQNDNKQRTHDVKDLLVAFYLVNHDWWRQNNTTVTIIC